MGLWSPRSKRVNLSCRAVEAKKKAVKRIEEQLMKLEVQATDREENKQIALGTSKLNYLDPRISVAWWGPWILSAAPRPHPASDLWTLFSACCRPPGVKSGTFPSRRSTTKPSVISLPGPSTWQIKTLNFKTPFVVLTEKKRPIFYWMFFILIGFFARRPGQEIHTFWAEKSSDASDMRDQGWTAPQEAKCQ